MSVGFLFHGDFRRSSMLPADFASRRRSTIRRLRPAGIGGMARVVNCRSFYILDPAKQGRTTRAQSASNSENGYASRFRQMVDASRLYSDIRCDGFGSGKQIQFISH
jgi:hypothetical protein